MEAIQNLVLENLYSYTKENGTKENKMDVFFRVAHHVGGVNNITHKFIENRPLEYFEVMRKNEFLPNSPTLMNSGNTLGQLSACFVLPVPDDIEGIYETLKNTAIIHKTGGGTGFSFSNIRPEGALVGSTGGKASGVISFMKVFNASCDTIKQGGKRRGANMGILSVHHPEIQSFIKCKEDLTQLTNFNLSIAISGVFMEAVISDRKYPIYKVDGEHSLADRIVAEMIPAKEVFELITTAAWKTGEPAVLFMDTINEKHPKVGELIEATNPCGEQPLLPYESCCLGSINLVEHVNKDCTGLDIDKLEKTIKTAVCFLDDVLSVTKFPLKQIKEKTLAYRKIGLGVMGFADVLYMLGLRYGSQEANDFAEKTMCVIQECSHFVSNQLAVRSGSPYPMIDKVHPRITIEDKNYKRNLTITTIAPTGSISILAGVSGGIEPNFALHYKRKVHEEYLDVLNPVLEKLIKTKELDREEIIEYLQTHGKLPDTFTEKEKHVFVIAPEVTPQEHVDMLAAFQKYIDNAVSKTVNLPESATVQDVSDIYISAWKKGCKGVTIYRDGSRNDQPLS